MQALKCINNKCKMIYTPDAVVVMLHYKKKCVCGADLNDAVIDFDYRGKSPITQSDVWKAMEVK